MFGRQVAAAKRRREWGRVPEAPSSGTNGAAERGNSRGTPDTDSHQASCIAISLLQEDSTMTRSLSGRKWFHFWIADNLS